MPILYFDNIARYVRNGGAVLLAAGPEYGKEGSIAQTPLDDVLPALPDGISPKHPSNRKSPNSAIGIPSPGGSIMARATIQTGAAGSVRSGSRTATGEVVMETASNEPLLVLERYDEGRVALLLSDHAWLWARGFEGGGPHVQLLRRMAHWLMKEPELEEERLMAEREGDRLVVNRQTLGDNRRKHYRSET